YAFGSKHARKDSRISSLAGEAPVSNQLWMIARDFNVVADLEEKSGGKSDDDDSMCDFRSFMAKVGVSDAGFKGVTFTWSNNQDGNNKILDEYRKVKAAFKYWRMWRSHADYDRLVKEHWEGCLHRDTLISLVRKLKRLGKAFSAWNFAVFRNGDRGIRETKDRIEGLERELQIGWQFEAAEELKRQQQKLLSHLRNRHAMLEDKARVSWLRFRDDNSAFFRASITQRIANPRLTLKDTNGVKWEFEM
uniref:Uncharacterized protein n=1 Tax=Kalanchoe fedtschenkoi TaxID=63787 RepID=A0A7N0TMM3_KALFE